jgi:hypothetical protein
VFQRFSSQYGFASFDGEKLEVLTNLKRITFISTIIENSNQIGMWSDRFALLLRSQKHYEKDNSDFKKLISEAL